MSALANRLRRWADQLDGEKAYSTRVVLRTGHKDETDARLELSYDDPRTGLAALYAIGSPRFLAPLADALGIDVTPPGAARVVDGEEDDS